MSRLTTILPFSLMLTALPLAAAQQTAVPTPVTMTEADKVETTTTSADGSRVDAGHTSRGQDTCAPQAAAFVEKTNADGTLAWRRANRPEAGEQALFSLGTVDAGLVASSAIYGAMVDETNGDVIVAGELIYNWQDEFGNQVGTRGGFVVLLASDGTPLAEAYLGTAPSGPAVDSALCEAVCEGLDNTGYEHFGIRGLALAPGGVVATGWRRPDSWSSTDFLVAAFTQDLTLLWSSAPFNLGDDAGLAVTVDATGQIFATGYANPSRDVAVARFTPDGALADYTVDGGALDDEGHSIALDGTNVVVEGIFTDLANFDGVVLNGTGEGRSEFMAVYDAALDLVSAEKTSGGGVQQSPAPTTAKAVKNGMGSHKNYPGSLAILTGVRGTGNKKQLRNNDDEYLHVYSQNVGGTDTIVYETIYDINPMAPLLDAIRVVATSAFCYRVRVEIGNGSNGFSEIGTAELCPYEEPSLDFEIPADLADQLGFQSANGLRKAPGRDWKAGPPRLVVRTTIEFEDSWLKGGSQGDCGSVNETTLSTEYP